jgi:hypothetical protein
MSTQQNMTLVGGLPRATSIAPRSEPPAVVPLRPAVLASPFNIDQAAARLHSLGYSLWLRFDGEEFVADLLCGVEHMPANIPRPHGRGVTAQQAIEAADRERARMEKR